MLPPEFYSELAKIHDHELENSPPKTKNPHTVLTVIIVAVTLLLILATLYFY
jgi:hypothetical protein